MCTRDTPGSHGQLARRDLGASMVLIRRYVMAITYVPSQRRFTAAKEKSKNNPSGAVRMDVASLRVDPGNRGLVLGEGQTRSMDVRAGLRLKDQFPQHDIKVGVVQADGSTQELLQETGLAMIPT